MSLLRDAWKNFADRLFDRELISRLDEHERYLDDSNRPLEPFPDPHPQYLNVILDTAWSGMGIQANGPVLVPGDIVAPWDDNSLEDWNLTKNLTAGTFTLAQDGLYQINLYMTFQAVSSGGTFLFEIEVDGVGTGLISVADLSNQSDIGPVTIVGAFAIAPGASTYTLQLRFDAISSKSVTILNANWSVVKLFPSPQDIGDFAPLTRVTEDGLDNRVSEDGLDTRITE